MESDGLLHKNGEAIILPGEHTKIYTFLNCLCGIVPVL